MAAFYRREREHEVMGSAAGALPVSAKEGRRRSVLSAEDFGVLWRAAGAFAGGGVVWCRGEQTRPAAAAVPSPRHGRGPSDQRGRGGWTRAACRAHGASWFPSLGQHLCKVLSLLPLQDSAPKVFDEMPARSKNSNF
jgi:hypothetical protein